MRKLADSAYMAGRIEIELARQNLPLKPFLKEARISPIHWINMGCGLQTMKLGQLTRVEERLGIRALDLLLPPAAADAEIMERLAAAAASLSRETLTFLLRAAEGLLRGRDDRANVDAHYRARTYDEKNRPIVY